MLVKDFVKEFIETFNNKVVGKIIVPGCEDKLINKACLYPLIGTGFHISHERIVAPIQDLHNNTLHIPIFRVLILSTFHEPSKCEKVERLSLEPSTYIEDIPNYENLTTKELIYTVKMEILKEKLTIKGR